jgi:hypothetical protein
MIDIDKIWQAVVAVLLAVAGGLARILNMKNSQKMSVKRMFSELFISGFAGLMVLMLARSTGITGDLIGVVAGIAGWIGPKALDSIVKSVSRTTRVGLDDVDDDKQ